MPGKIHRVYGFLRNLMPHNMRGRITYLLYLLKLKPTINKKVNFSFPKGILVISADFEMAWAFRYSKTIKDAEEKGLLERRNVPIILSILEKYNLPVTWVTVGHLFMEKCEKSKSGMAHPEMPRPGYFENRNWKYDQGDWYDDDPCTNYKDSPAWYAPDLIDKILSSSVNHEIGCHTFSHIDFTYNNCTRALAEAEINKCIELANKKNIKLTSFVFPGGTYGNFDVLKQYGFTAYRKKTNYDIGIPYKDKQGLVVIPASFGMDKPPYNWSARTCVEVAKSYIDSAIKHKMVVHLWFHPSVDPWYLKYVFPEVMKYIAQKREESNLDVMTMKNLTIRIKNN